MGRGDVRREADQAVLHEGMRVLGECAHGRGDLGRGGDHVVGGPRGDPPDGHDDGVQRVELPGDRGLQGDDDLGGDGHRVGGEVRHRPVPAATAHRDGQGVGRSENRARPGRHEPRREHGRHHVQPVGGGDALAGCVEHPLVDHHARTVVALLAGLEHEHHGAGDLRAVRDEQAGRADEACGVQVVPAGVHRAGVLARELLAGVLGDRKRVHVRAQQDGGPGPSAANHGDDGAEGRARRDLEVDGVVLLDLVKRREHRGLGERQVQPDLRDAVQPAPEVDQDRCESGGLGEQARGGLGHVEVLRVLDVLAACSLRACGMLRRSVPRRYSRGLYG
ncbi:hypothetical protein GALL_374350 [mine drainage metagenome]|uniref:Uncharacterized protein n=1 Tax=mine drainage metagenome TaxID=410659 RepID=A0A1J5QLJ3_9ZZZZ